MIPFEKICSRPLRSLRAFEHEDVRYGEHAMTLPELRRAAQLLRSADALLIGAGAGMGVDSGLPDFRGTEGFWNAYPAYAKLGLDFASMANPRWFRRDPELRLGLLRPPARAVPRDPPHPGFALLRTWASRHAARRLRLHLQRRRPVPEGGLRRGARRRSPRLHPLRPVPRSAAGSSCPPRLGPCGGPGDVPGPAAAAHLPGAAARSLRPNILMFGDWGWDASRTEAQEQRLAEWLDGGAARRVWRWSSAARATAIPSVRRFCERAAAVQAGDVDAHQRARAARCPQGASASRCEHWRR